jgi:hypothetical protein
MNLLLQRYDSFGTSNCLRKCDVNIDQWLDLDWIEAFLSLSEVHLIHRLRYGYFHAATPGRIFRRGFYLGIAADKTQALTAIDRNFFVGL